MAGPDDPATRMRLGGLEPAEWSNGPGDSYPAHRHGYDKVIVVAAGSTVFSLPGRGARLGLVAGDRLELPAGTDHDAVVGGAGVRCLEAQLPAGSLAAPRRLSAGAW